MSTAMSTASGDTSLPVEPSVFGRSPSVNSNRDPALFRRAPVRAASEPPQAPQQRASRSLPPRSSSPTPSTAGFSIIGLEEAEDASDFYGYRTPYKFSSLGRRQAARSAPALSDPASDTAYTSAYSSSNYSLKSLLPRIWDALVLSPSRIVLSTSRYPLAASASVDSSPSRKGKGKAATHPSYCDLNGEVDFATLPPLDDEEGELIDDEACFVTVDFWGSQMEGRVSRARVVTGIDILGLLPPELSLHVLILLCTTTPSSIPTTASLDYTESPLHAIIACFSVSKTWRKIANDNAVWRELYTWQWGKISDQVLRSHWKQRQRLLRRRALCGRSRSDFEISHRSPNMPGIELGRLNVQYKELSFSCENDYADMSGPLTVTWQALFRERCELEKRWKGTARVPASTTELPGSYPPIGSHEKWEPMKVRITGHTDSVYCLEFNRQYIITGSRDQTIRVWSSRTGKCLGTFGKFVPSIGGAPEVRGHTGSVLCLKFFWDFDEEFDATATRTVPDKRLSIRRNLRKGILFSGSSDCTICVWKLFAVPRRASRRPPQASSSSHVLNRPDDFDDQEVRAEVTNVLRGHGAGVLDLKVDKKWIVSCSKDAAVRIWDRQTMLLHRTLKGHEGPVNAIGLEGGCVVSASGDGKMIIWDIQSGNPLKTLEGHDRGLACVEFKNGIIISGSNDCKIKIWQASTGECLRTLVGHEALVRALAYEPRSGRLVSASYDRSIRIWDFFTGKLVRELRNVHTSHIFDVKFDISKVISASHDHTLAVFEFGLGLENANLFS